MINYYFQYAYLNMEFHLQARETSKTLHLVENQIREIDFLYCDADKHKLGKVFRNLFSNAMKFTGTGGRIVATAHSLIPLETYGEHRSSLPALRMAVVSPSSYEMSENARATHMLRIEVSDDGAGMSKV